MPIERSGAAIVISAPSGGGKTTLCHKVIERLGQVAFSISHTTRKPRASERDGIDYHFVSDTIFDCLLAEGAFLEWAHVHGHRYGTHKHMAKQLLDSGIDVLFDIDTQGGKQIKDAWPNTALIYVLPPDLKTLATRLTTRHQDSDDQIKRRLAAAVDEMQAVHSYTHIIVNQDLMQATDDLTAIVLAERLRHVKRDILLQKVTGIAPS